MNPEILNLYIDRLLNEIHELTRNRLLIETQLKYTEKMNADLATKIKSLEAELDKITTRSTSKGKKEVNTSETF